MLRLLLAILISHLALRTAAGETISTRREPRLSSEVLAKVTETMNEFVKAKKIAGAVTMISHHGQIIYCEAIGHQNIEANLPMRRDTIFRIYSMTKPITSVAAMMLVERGELELDAPLSEYDPRFSDLRVHVAGSDGESRTAPLDRPLTIRDLLRHTSGFSYGGGLTEIDSLYRQHRLGRRHGDRLEVSCGKLAELPLLHQPGTRFRYSISTDVLGHVVERVSGKRLDDFLATEIFAPLEMTDTNFHVPAEERGRFAANYSPRLLENGLRRIDDPETSRFLSPPKMLSGGGGLLSTAGDYMKFCHMLVAQGRYEGDRLLKPETIAEMTRNQIPEPLLPISIVGVPLRGMGFGLGFAVRVEKGRYTPIGEYGWAGMASTMFWISPQYELAVVVLTQYVPYNQTLADEIKQILYQALRDCEPRNGSSIP